MNDTTRGEPGSEVTVRPSGQSAVGLVPAQGFDLTPKSFEEALQLAEVLASSELVPKDYQRKAANVLVAVQWGHEIGLKPMQALQNIAVINGRPSLWGDAMIALVRSDARCEYIVESFDPAGTAVCQVKRRGEQEQARTFSLADAKTAGLEGKAGPWTQYPKRMRQMRARSLALRDVFADVLKGIPMAEEAIDLPPLTATPLGQLAGTAPEIPPELAKAGAEASAAGLEAYTAWFQAIGAEKRKVVQFDHPTWKAAAIAVDAAKKAEEEKAAAATAAAETAGPTFGDVVEP